MMRFRALIKKQNEIVNIFAVLFAVLKLKIKKFADKKL